MNERIKAIRKKSGLSQAAFSEKYHIPVRTIQDWEGSKRVPPIYVVKLLERTIDEDFSKK